ncbi:MAG: RidA family protein [Jatrophihabitans sp.]
MNTANQIRVIHSETTRPPIWQSEAVIAGPFVFTSAALATDWNSGIAPEAAPHPDFPYFTSAIELQTNYILHSLSQTLAAAGSSLSQIVKANVFLTDPSDFLGFDRAWSTHFATPPTRTTVAVDGLLIPGARIEVSVTALHAGSGIDAQPASSDSPRPMTRKVEAITAGRFAFTSGQLAHDAVNGVPPEATGDQTPRDITKQTTYIVENMLRSLSAAGVASDQVVKGQALLTDVSDTNRFSEAWRAAFGDRATLGIAGIKALLVTGTIIEIDLTAYLGETVLPSIGATLRGPDALGCGELVFSAGIYVGMDSGKIPSGLVAHPSYPHYSSTIKSQTEWVLDRLDAALTSAGSSLARTAKAQVFLRELTDFAIFDGVWRARFDVPPARSVVQAAALPSDAALIAVEAIALSK